MTRRILIADNDAAYALALRELLNSTDDHYEFEVYLTETVEDALGLLEIQGFHVVVIDSRLIIEEGRDGKALIGRIKDSHLGTRIMVISESLSPQDVIEVYGQGADLMLEKPFKVNEFLLAIKTLGVDRRKIAV